MGAPPIFGTSPTSAADVCIKLERKEPAHQLDLNKVKKHIVAKAGYKEFGGRCITKNWTQWFKESLIGNSYEDHNLRTQYTATHRVSASLFAAKFKSFRSGSIELKQLCDDPRVIRSFWSLDNLSVNSKLWGELGDDLSRERLKQIKNFASKNATAARWSRWSHYFRGFIECTIAPSGLTKKWADLLAQPKRDPRSIGNHVYSVGALGVLTGVTAGLTTGLLIYGLKNGISNINTLMAGILASYSAFGALFSGLSLISAGISRMTLNKQERLTETAKEDVIQNHSKHLSYLTQLLLEVVDKKGAQELLSKALMKKIPAARCKNGGTVLLQYLLNKVNDYKSNGKPYVGWQNKELQAEIERALGAYLVVQDLSGLLEKGSEKGSASPAHLDEKKSSRQLLYRENDVLALLNLVEHARIQKKEAFDRVVDPKDGKVLYKTQNTSVLDMRMRSNNFIEFVRDKVLYNSAKALNATGSKPMQNQAKKILAWVTNDGMKLRETRKQDVNERHRIACDIDHILDNYQEYSRPTVFFARLAEAIRVFNIGVVLSLNYLVTRPFASSLAWVQTHVFGLPEERTVSWAFGRFMSSACWAVAEFMVFIGLASGQGVLPEGHGAFENQPTMPLKVGEVFISVISTAMHMFLVGWIALIPATIAVCLAKNGGRINAGAPRIFSERELERRKATQWA